MIARAGMLLAMALATFANALDHQFFRDRTRQLRTMITSQHRQQQVENGHATASG